VQVDPLVSVVTSTYNRSNVLRWTIRSVLAQSIDDWELIVVGDGCTDDTAEVVGSFGDERITFTDLGTNSGDQSAPNNEGVRRARGRYLAYLNHDDLWFPDHLERTVEVLRRDEADLVHTLVDRLYSDGRRIVDGNLEGGRYEPGAFVPASAWVMQRALADRVGPWRHHTEMRTIPSQDWLVRAWRSGARISLVPWLTVAAMGTSSRPDCYANRDEEEQASYWSAIGVDPTTRERVLTELLVQQPGWLAESADFLRRVPATRLLKALLYRPVKPLLLWLGADPRRVRQVLAMRPRGAQVAELRRIRGLETTTDHAKAGHGRRR
jgi:hypothetical protein